MTISPVAAVMTFLLSVSIALILITSILLLIDYFQKRSQLQQKPV